MGAFLVEKYDFSGVLSYKINITDNFGRNVTTDQLSDAFGMTMSNMQNSIEEIVNKINVSNGLFHVFPYDENDIMKTKIPSLYFEEDGYYHFIYKVEGAVNEFMVISIIPVGNEPIELVVKCFKYLTKKFKKCNYKMEIYDKQPLKGHLVIDGSDEDTSYLLLYYQQVIFQKVDIVKKFSEKKSNIMSLIFFLIIFIIILIIHLYSNEAWSFEVSKGDLLLFLYPLLFSTITPPIATLIDSKGELKIKNLKTYKLGERKQSDEEKKVSTKMKNLEEEELVVEKNG